MNRPRMVCAYAYGHGLAFTPRVRVIATYTHPWLGHVVAICKVTGRDQAHRYHGYRPGDDVEFRASSLYTARRVVRGACGRFVYYGSPDLSGLPVMVRS